MKLVHEQIQYIEFRSPDLLRIRTFYEAAFGWEFTDYGAEYTAFTGEYCDGGFAIGKPQSGSIIPILYSSSLEETKTKVAAAGGAIIQDTFDFPGGRRFHFTDIDGNELAVWSDARRKSGGPETGPPQR